MASLSDVDSIMEPDVLARLKAYISGSMGGNAALKSQPDRVKDAIRMLSDSYRGRAQICNRLMHWIGEIMGESHEDLNQVVMDHMKEMAVQQFDVAKADSIFSASNKGEPEWLTFMIRDPTWRSVLYKLSQEHPNCLLLNFAIQKISEEGHGNELAVSARSGDVKFAVFKTVFHDALKQIVQCASEDAFSKSVAELQRLCCQTQATYLFSQYILTALERHPATGLIWRHLSHEVSQCASAEHGERTRVLDLLLTNAPKHPEVFRVLSALQRGGRLTTTDVKHVYELYTSNNPAPVGLLRQNLLIQPLIDSLFSHERAALDPAHRKCYVYLLAYASCVRDHRLWFTAQSTEAGIDETMVDKSRMNATVTAINEVSVLCQNKEFGFHISSSELVFRQHLTMPVISYSLLYWLRLSLLSPAYYSTTYQSVCTPVFIRLLGRIATLHPLQRSQVFELLCATFHLRTDLNDLAVIKFRKMIIEVLIHLVHYGLLTEVTGMVAENVPRMDHSLVRFFIVQILQTTGPAYSNEFANSIFSIVAMPDATLAIRNHPDSVQQVERFAVNVAAMDLPDLREQCHKWGATPTH